MSAALWYNLGLSVVVLCLGIMAVVAYRAWTEAHEDIEPCSDADLLASFERARADGALDQEEFERVKRRLQG